MAQLGADTAARLLQRLAPTPSTTTRSPPHSSTRSPSAPAQHGVRIAYEALAWGRHVSEYDHAWRIVEPADHPALGICLDSFHILARRTGAGRHRRHPGRQALLLPARRRAAIWPWTCWSGAGTTAASRARAPSTSWTSPRACCAAGYDGPLSLEVFNDALRDADPGRVARDARRSLAALEDQLRAAGPRRGARTARIIEKREGDGEHRNGQPRPRGERPARRRARRRSPAGSAASWSTTTSSSTAPPPRWSSARCSSPTADPDHRHAAVARDLRRRPTSRGRSARSSWATSATATAASACWCSPSR